MVVAPSSDDADPPTQPPSDVRKAASTERTQLLFMILVTVFVSIGILVVSIISSHAHGGSVHDSSIRSWLQQHPPRKVSHDADLLRRRVLADYTERPPAELAEHVPAILASLDHSDYHIRRLAGGLLSRLEPVAIGPHATEIAERLESDDESVRLHVVQALGLLPARRLEAFADRLVESLDDDDDGVRWAAVDSLSGLSPAALANRTEFALQKMLDRQESSLARSAVSTWLPKLESSGAPQGVVDRLAAWNYKLNFAGMGQQQQQMAMGGGGE